MKLKNPYIFTHCLVVFAFGILACSLPPTQPQNSNSTNQPSKSQPIQFQPNKNNQGVPCKKYQYYTHNEEKTAVFRYCYELQKKLCEAASRGDLQEIKESLRDGAQVDSTYADHFPALHSAAQSGYEKTVLLLLDNGADINLVFGFQITPLGLASMEGHEKVVQILIERGADVCYETSEGTMDQLAQKAGHQKVANVLKAARLTHCQTKKAPNQAMHADSHPPVSSMEASWSGVARR